MTDTATASAPAHRLTRKHLRAGIVLGLILITAWFAVTRTTLLVAYRAGTLAQAQALCDSPLGRWARTTSAQAAANCHGADSLSAWMTAAGFAGALLVGASAAVLLWRAQDRPAGQ